MFWVIVASAEIHGNLMDAIDMDNDEVLRADDWVSAEGTDVMAELYP